MRRPFNRAFLPQTPIDSLLDFSRTRDCWPPDSFIFHMSHGGSMPLAQLFTALADTRVTSKANPIEQVLCADLRLPGQSAYVPAEWLRAIMLAYGASAQSPFERPVVKFNASHVHRPPSIEQALPDVPWVLLFRHPLEVLVSNLALHAASTIPGAAIHGVPGVDPIAALDMPEEQYLALVLQHDMRAAPAHRENPRALFVDYAD